MRVEGCISVRDRQTPSTEVVERDNTILLWFPGPSSSAAVVPGRAITARPPEPWPQSPHLLWTPAPAASYVRQASLGDQKSALSRPQRELGCCNSAVTSIELRIAWSCPQRTVCYGCCPLRDAGKLERKEAILQLTLLRWRGQGTPASCASHHVEVPCPRAIPPLAQGAQCCKLVLAAHKLQAMWGECKAGEETWEESTRRSCS